jgi:ankyrin repeat protein
MPSKLADASFEGDLDLVRQLVESGVNLSEVNDIGHTALHNAIENDHIEIAAYLLRSGADPNEEDSSRETPLTHAIHVYGDAARQMRQGRPSTAMISLLLANGADPNLVPSTPISECGRSPVEAARFWGNQEVSELLERAGATA